MSTAGDVAARILTERAHGRVERNGSIAPLTSYRLGGPADVMLEAAGVEDLEALAAAIKETGVPVLVVGRGSNMLVSDRGFDGVALRLGAGFRWSKADGTTIEFSGDRDEIFDFVEELARHGIVDVVRSGPLVMRRTV